MGPDTVGCVGLSGVNSLTRTHADDNRNRQTHHSHYKHGGAAGGRPEGLSEQARALRDSGESPARIPPDDGGGDTLEPIAHKRSSGPRLVRGAIAALGTGGEPAQGEFLDTHARRRPQ